jgi:hypothetical protein
VSSEVTQYWHSFFAYQNKTSAKFWSECAKWAKHIVRSLNCVRLGAVFCVKMQKPWKYPNFIKTNFLKNWKITNWPYIGNLGIKSFRSVKFITSVQVILCYWYLKRRFGEENLSPSSGNKPIQLGLGSLPEDRVQSPKYCFRIHIRSKNNVHRIRPFYWNTSHELSDIICDRY